LGVHRVDGAYHGLQGAPSFIGQLEGHPPPVVEVRAAGHVAAIDQHLDGLAHRLLGHAQLAGQVGAGSAGLVDTGQNERPVPR
jgi:hypothetical protein